MYGTYDQRGQVADSSPGVPMNIISVIVESPHESLKSEKGFLEMGSCYQVSSWSVSRGGGSMIARGTETSPEFGISSEKVVLPPEGRPRPP
ncbi:hypothetical protein TNCV_3177701 [Trichonephila clavipes]|nr:hypothetical protein TNCV_3177701 [Trichonephila clavipes]